MRHHRRDRAVAAASRRRLRAVAEQLAPLSPRGTASRTTSVPSRHAAAAATAATGGESDSDRCLYFAYGSNMATSHTVAHCPSAVALGTALLPNFAIGFRRYSPGPMFLGGISTVELAAGQGVQGVLFSVAVAELEAWDADYAEDQYYRAPAHVLPLSAAAALASTGSADDASSGGSSTAPLVSAEVYLPDPLEGPFAPAPNYVELMVAGAREHGLHAHAEHVETVVATQAAAAAAAAAAADDAADDDDSGGGGGLEVNIPSVVAELTETFERYEKALDANDVDGLDTFFWRNAATTRLANAQHGYGFDAIHRHRAATRATGISGSTKGQRVRVVVTTLGRCFGTVMYEYLVRGNPERTGRQSQTFVKFPPSPPPPPPPAPVPPGGSSVEGLSSEVSSLSVSPEDMAGWKCTGKRLFWSQLHVCI